MVLLAEPAKHMLIFIDRDSSSRGEFPHRTGSVFEAGLRAPFFRARRRCTHMESSVVRWQIPGVEKPRIGAV